VSFRASIAVAAVALFAMAAPGATPAQAASPAITLSPSAGPPTTRIKVSGSGFGANEAVDVYFDATDMVLASTDGTGAFTVTFKVPASAHPGTHYVTAVGRSSGLSAQRTFNVNTNWAEFHFGPAHLGWNPYENTLSTANVSSLDEVWATQTGGFELDGASPTVANGTVYVGSSDGKVYALNAATGAVKWTRHHRRADRHGPGRRGRRGLRRLV